MLIEKSSSIFIFLAKNKNRRVKAHSVWRQCLWQGDFLGVLFLLKKNVFFSPSRRMVSSMSRILVALSGGVDSAVAAALLLKEGHTVVGAYMQNWINQEGIEGHCPWQEDIEDAQKIAQHLGIELRVIDLIDAYQQRIVSYLLNGYASGVTPNPDVMCNREMKFGVFLDYALEQGFDAMATGHYVRRRQRSNGWVDILRGSDPNKDQSYFLSLLSSQQVSKAYFPCGEFPKPLIRKKATEMGLPVAQKKDSQGICFLGKVKMRDFLRHYLPDTPGDIVNVEGEVLGEHQGVHLYTLGQRKGHGVASPYEGKAYVVVGKEQATNRLIVGFDKVRNTTLYTQTWHIGSMSKTNPSRHFKSTLEIAPRYRSHAEKATLLSMEGDNAIVRFANPQRAIAPGQIAAFYDGGILLGGGVFTHEHA